jgi:hypothetical protein
MVPAALSFVERLAFELTASFASVFDDLGLGSGMLTGKRGWWSLAKPGVRPNSGKSPPKPLMRNCWAMLKMVVVIQ